jgi:molybdate transport system substrate-binding protein
MSEWSCRVIKGVIVLTTMILLTGCTIGPGGGCGSGPGSGACALRPEPVTVFAAASLQPAFDAFAQRYHGVFDVTFNYAGTQTLTAQLQQGAPADVFASADTEHMATVQSAGLLAGTPSVLAHNKLEIVVDRGNPKNIHTLADLARPGLVVVLADPSVPAGKYAKQALAKAGVSVNPASLETQVTGVLSKVALGEADAGIVYVSDIVTSGKVEGVAIPDAQNVTADYMIALVQSGAHVQNGDHFMQYVLASDGQKILKDAGFEPA